MDKASDFLYRLCLTIKNDRSSYLKEIRLDNGREFLRFIIWAEKEGIYIEPSALYIYQQNGVSKFSGYYLI